MDTQMYEEFKLLNTNIEKSIILMNDLENINNSFNSKTKGLLAFIQRRKLRKMAKKVESLASIILEDLHSFKKSLKA